MSNRSNRSSPSSSPSSSPRSGIPASAFSASEYSYSLPPSGVDDISRNEQEEEFDSQDQQQLDQTQPHKQLRASSSSVTVGTDADSPHTSHSSHSRSSISASESTVSSAPNVQILVDHPLRSSSSGTVDELESAPSQQHQPHHQHQQRHQHQHQHQHTQDKQSSQYTQQMQHYQQTQQQQQQQQNHGVENHPQHQPSQPKRQGSQDHLRFTQSAERSLTPEYYAQSLTQQQSEYLMGNSQYFDDSSENGDLDLVPEQEAEYSSTIHSTAPMHNETETTHFVPNPRLEVNSISTKIQRMLFHPCCAVYYVLFTLLNAVLVIYGIRHTATFDTDESEDITYAVFDSLSILVVLIEVALRVLAAGKKCLLSIWNIFDGTIAFLSCMCVFLYTFHPVLLLLASCFIFIRFLAHGIFVIATYLKQHHLSVVGDEVDFSAASEPSVQPPSWAFERMDENSVN